MANTWDDICKSISGFAKQAGRKLERLSDTAAIRLKISAKKAELEEAYIALGKAVYEQSSEYASDSTESDTQDQINAITALLAEIDTLEQKLASDKDTDE